VDFAIATGSRQLFPTLVMLPCYDWDRIILVPKGHPLSLLKAPVDLAALAAHPLITYVFSSTGESSFRHAFAEQGLEPQVVFTARDADIIKTYVRMGMGAGVVASMAFECSDERDLVALDAVGLFPRVTTWLGFRRDSVLRGYMVEFVSLFAPQLTPELVRKAASLPTQAEVDALFAGMKLPLRAGCAELQPAA
jgi:LysR family cys regulon transcriptional activator